ncbi:MAG TPA: hypothetical protein VMV07_08670 [Streptosporangiaceae bacterium]|nr:hypothetical protein [Streptosporangiaceae bacterium]
MNRRQLLAVAAASTATGALEPFERLRFALSGAGPDTALVDDLERSTATFFDTEERTPAGQLSGALDAHVDVLAGMTAVARSDSVRRRLIVCAGESAALAGWVRYDLGEHRAARGYWDAAITAAREAGDGPLLACVLSYLSYLSAEQGDARQAWILLDQASEHVRSREHAAARAWIAARQAEEAASLGDASALVSLERAMTAMDYAEPETGRSWVRFFDNARLGSMAVTAYGRLAHPGLTPAADAVLASVREDAKTRAVILGDVATAHVRAGDIDAGCDLAVRALDATLTGEATLGRQRLRALAPMLRDVDSLAARQTYEQITSAVP